MTSHVRAMPVVAIFVDDALVVGTDAGEWLSIACLRAPPGSAAGSANDIQPLATTGPFSAVVRDAAGIVVASWEPKLLQLRGPALAEGWTEIAIGSPALALAVVKQGLAIADIGGGLSLLATGSRMPIQELAATTPVVELMPLGDGLAVLGANGTLDVTRWPGSEPTSLVPVEASAIGRPHALFEGMQPGTVLVAGSRGVGILNGSRLTAVTTDLPERIRGAAVFHKRGLACLHDDTGGAWIVDDTLQHAGRVRLASASLVGVSAGAQNDSLLAWTADGALHIIHSDGSTDRLAYAGRDVVLAVPEPARPKHGIAIHWNAADGARVTRGHVAWT